MVSKTHTMTLCTLKQLKSRTVETTFTLNQTIDIIEEVNRIYIMPWWYEWIYADNRTNDDCPLSLTTRAAKVAVTTEIWFWIRWLKKKKENNVEK